MERLAGNRIALTPRPVERRVAVLEAALLGHCPGRVRLERLLALTTALDEMRSAGFGAAVDDLLSGAPSALENLPIPLRAGAEFHDIFPDAATAPTQYASRLGGNRAWLANAVDDFFANGGEKLWTVRIPEGDGQDGFMPAPNTVLHDPATLRGLAVVLAIPTVAVVGLPDLERLQIPAPLRDAPDVQQARPTPQFLPCASVPDDEEPAPPIPSASPAPRPLAELLFDDHRNARMGLLSLVVRHRPDVQCLLTLPLAYSAETAHPDIDPDALESLAAIRDGGSGHVLRHVQFLFPYLRGPRYSLHSPVGLIAGQQSAVARRLGPWRSMAARALATDGLPYPRLSLARMMHLREEPGIGLIHHRSGQTALDDERLVVPALPPADYAAVEDRRRFDGFRTAELMRFLGYLRRQLQALGEQLVFDADFRDPRPRIALERFMRRLHALGALRGALPEDAFQIIESQPQDGALLFEIVIAPAFPIDRLLLTFANLDGEWRTEVDYG